MSDWVASALLDWPLTWLGQEPSGDVPPYGDSGVATLVLDLQNGYTVGHSWVTDVIKFRAGAEQRISRNDSDRESYSGVAFLGGTRPREVRAQLARYAAIGSVFLLAVPHESLSCVASATTIVSVNPDALALTDWASPGQRVVVVSRNADGERIGTDAVIQSVGSSTITLDVSVSGDEIMPARAIFLEPQQNFPRFRANVEQWQIEARGAPPLDYAPDLASLDLGPLTDSAAFDDVTVVSRVFGLPGNLIAFAMVSDGSDGTLAESGTTVTFHFNDGVTTLGDLATALESSSLVMLSGTYEPTDTIAAADAFFSELLSGASAAGDVGTGATLTTYATHPIWTEEIANSGTIVDGMQAMTQIIDHGGITYAIGTADQADWFRAVAIEGGDHATWQWFKLFMSTVVGRQKKFWLPTWREDLGYSSHSGTSLVIDADDFAAWWPSQREHVQIEQGATRTYAKITAATGSGDTRTLTLSASLSAAAVTRISWLELCRFEDADTYQTTHDEEGFAVELIARVVQ